MPDTGYTPSTELHPEGLELATTKSGRKVLKRKNQKLMAGKDLKAKAQEEVKSYLRSLGKVTFI